MIKPMRKYRITGHIREIKSDEITRGKNDNNKVIKKVNYITC